MEKNEKTVLDENLRALQTGLLLQLDINKRISAEMAGLHLVVRSLVATHPNPEAFVAKMKHLEEAFLAREIPGGWSEDHIRVAQRYVEKNLEQSD